MASPYFSDIADKNYLAKGGKNGVKPSVLFPKGAKGKVKEKYPGIPKKGMKFIKPGCPEY